MFKHLNAVNSALFRIGSCVIFFAISLLTGIDAIMRYCVGMPVFGAYDLAGLGLLLAIIFALPDSLRRGCHVRMDIFYDSYRARMRSFVDSITRLGAAAFAALVAWQAFHYVPQHFASGEATITLGVPIWPFTLMIGGACALFCLSILGEVISPQSKQDIEQ